MNDALKYIELHKGCHRLKGATVDIGVKLVTQMIDDIHNATPEELTFRGAIMVKKLWRNYCITRVDFEKYMMNATLKSLLGALKFEVQHFLNGNVACENTSN